MTFLQAEKKRQTEWKLKTKYLSREAKKPGLYCSRLFPFCLPIEHSEENLFPPIRDEALTYFRLNDISWHGSALPGKPSNHRNGQKNHTCYKERTRLARSTL